MGAAESRGSGGHNGDSDSDSEDWMQADKYAEWDCADHMDYNGTAMTVRHVEMPLNADEKARILSGANQGFSSSIGLTHEALVFEVMCADGRLTKFTAEFTFSGVLKRWGYHKVISGVKGQKSICLPMTELLNKIQTKRHYELLSYNCKHYAAEKFKQF